MFQMSNTFFISFPNFLLCLDGITFFGIIVNFDNFKWGRLVRSESGLISVVRMDDTILELFDSDLFEPLLASVVFFKKFLICYGDIVPLGIKELRFSSVTKLDILLLKGIGFRLRVLGETECIFFRFMTEVRVSPWLLPVLPPKWPSFWLSWSLKVRLLFLLFSL